MKHLVTLLSQRRITVRDGFNRADNASSMGNANSGQTWSPTSGTWGILNNKAYQVTQTLQGVTVIDAGIGNGIVSCEVTFGPVSTDAGIILRAIDDNNYLMVSFAKTSGTDNIRIYKRDAGSFTLLAELLSAGNALSAMYMIAVVLNGNNISVYRDGVLKVIIPLLHVLSC